MTGASQATGLGSAKAPEPHSRLRPSGAIPCAFTPGPWKVYYATNGKMLGVGVDRPNDEDDAAGVTDAYGGLWGSGGEKEANAHLIAAAPELYDGCNALLGLIQLLAANPDTPPALVRILTENHRIAEAEAAVAKVRGEQVQP